MSRLSGQGAKLSELSEHVHGPIAAHLQRLEATLATLTTRLDALEQRFERIGGQL